MAEDMKLPLVSVVMCAYNADAFISEAIESVRSQNYSNWELIIIDDGSTDNTKRAVDLFNFDKRIQYYWQSNGKQGKARNRGVSIAKGDLIAFIDADDIWLPAKLEKQIEALNATNADVLFTSAEYFGGKDEKTAEVNEGVYDNASLFWKLQIGENPVVLSSVLIKKTVFKSAGGFNETPEIAEDFNLWLDLCDRGFLFSGLMEVLVRYRIHAGQTSQSESTALLLSVKAQYLVSFNKISKKERNVQIMARLNKYLVHNIEILTLKDRDRILSFMVNPLQKYFHFLTLKVFLSFNVTLFKKLSYRFLNLS